MCRFRLVTFDVNGTLLKVKESVGCSYFKAGRIHGVIANPDCLQLNFPKAWKRMNTIHPNFGSGEKLKWEDWWKGLVFQTFEPCMPRVAFKECQGKLNLVSDHLNESFSKPDAWELLPGAVDILQDLKKRDICVGVVSNFDTRLKGLLEGFGLSAYLRFLISSYDVNVCKPDLQIFRLAEKLYEETSGERFIGLKAIHVGDSYQLDYQPAKAAGWNAALIGNLGKGIEHSTINSILTFQNLNSLKGYLIQSRLTG